MSSEVVLPLCKCPAIVEGSSLATQKALTAHQASTLHIMHIMLLRCHDERFFKHSSKGQKELHFSKISFKNTLMKLNLATING